MKTKKWHMKRLVYIFAFGLLAAGLGSCDQDVDFPYQGKDRIQFQHYTVDYNGSRHYSDSTVFSFGLTPDSILVDTLKLVVEYTGFGSDRTRTYYVSVDADSTNAVSGKHYAAIEHEQKFRPGQLTDTLHILIFREFLPDDYTTTENIRLDLKVEVNTDFDLGLEGGVRKKILLNNYMSEPTWWQKELSGIFGFFHPEKWKFLIGLDEKLGTYGSIPYDRNSTEAKSYNTSLWNYLYHNVIIDEKTGMRVTMNGLEPIE